MLQHGHRSRSLCNRIYYGAGTPIPANAQRLLGLASDLDGHMRTSRAQVPVKTAMKKEQMPSVRRDRRKTRCCAPFTRKKSSYQTPYYNTQRTVYSPGPVVEAPPSDGLCDQGVRPHTFLVLWCTVY